MKKRIFIFVFLWWIGGAGLLLLGPSPIQAVRRAQEKLTTYSADLWSGILAPSRAMTWSSAGAGAIPARATICQTLTSSATFTTIRAALVSCNNTGQVVFLSAGNYTMTDSINVPGISNVTLRGAGPDVTNVNFTSFGVAGSGIYVENSASFDTTYSGDARVQDAVPGPAGANQSRWSAASYASGTTALTLVSHTNLFVGSAINLDQVDNTADPSPNGGPYTMQDAAHATDGGASNIGRPGQSSCNSTSTANGCRGFSQQVTIVSCGTSTPGAACTSNSIVITPGLNSSQWAAANLPGAWWSDTVAATGFGVEEMTLSVSGTGVGGGNAMIYFQSMAYSWVKHVKIVNGTTSATAFHKHIWFYGSNHMTARDSYMYGSRCSSESYGVDTGYNSSDNLIENNIFQKIATATIREGDAGSVFGYNYAVDNCYNGGIQQGDAYSHGIADHLGLWEGNIGSEMELDDIHGTNFLHTVFRNRYSGFDTGTENGASPGPYVAIQAYAGSRDHNAVGNVLGLTTKTTGYSAESQTSSDTAANGNSVFVGGYSGFGGSHVGCCNNDPFVPLVMMRFGNWDPVTVGNGIRACTANNVNVWPGSTNSACTEDELADTAPVVPALGSPSTTLPASFYLSAQPSWASGFPWPMIGPDVTGGNIANTGGHANLNPAADCYLNKMGGATDGSSGPLSFTGCPYSSTGSPVVSLSLTVLSFGRQLVTTTSAGLTTTLTNTGGATLTISSIALTSGTQFAITTNTCTSTLAASLSCSVTVKMTPTTLGAKADSLVFTTNASTSPDSVTVGGSGIPSTQVFDFTAPTGNTTCTNSNTGTPLATPAFQASFAYTTATFSSPTRVWVKPTSPNGHFYKVTTPGTSSTEPSWPTGSGATVTTGGVTFTEQGTTNAGQCRDDFFLYVLPNIDGTVAAFNLVDLDPSNGGCTAQAGGGYTFSTMDSTITGFTGAAEWGVQDGVVLLYRPGTYTNSNSWTPCYWLSATYAASLSASTNHVCFCDGYKGDKPTGTNSCSTAGTDTTGVPVPFDVPFNTAYNAFLAALTGHIKTSTYHSSVAYARHGGSIGGENFPFCASVMKVTYNYSTAQLKSAWTGAVKSFADQIKAATPNYPIVGSMSGVAVPGTGNVVGYDWADLEATYYAADGFGIGSQGLTQSDINAFASYGYSSGGTASVAGTYCSNDFCYNFHANPSALPLELQDGTVTNPTGAGTGSLVSLLGFAQQQQSTAVEVYNQDLFIAYDPNYPQNATYGTAYALAIYNLRHGIVGPTALPNGIYGQAKTSGQVVIQ